MTDLTINEVSALDGGSFWGGVSCGLGVTGSLILIVSPVPFSRLALLTYGSTVLSCTVAFL